MFRSGCWRSATSLVAALYPMVSKRRRARQRAASPQQRGRDHRRFSVVTERYDSGWGKPAGHLEAVLRPGTTDLADTWAQACGLVAKVMVAVAEEREDIAPAYWEAGSHATCEI